MPDLLSLGISIDAPDQKSAYNMGIELTRTIQKRLSGDRHGRWYPVPGNKWYDKTSPKENRAKNYYVKFTGTTNRNEILGGAYQASAPGEAPAVRTGRLRQSFFMTVEQTGTTGYRVMVRTHVNYADDLEYGTEKVEPRPFLLPALRDAMPVIIKEQIAGTLKMLSG